MRTMVLPKPLPAGANAAGSSKFWTRCSGLDEESASSFGGDFGSMILNIWIDASHENLRACIAHVLGYSEAVTISVPEKRFDRLNPAAQGPYRLSRKPPARHPDFPALRATKILSVQGRGLRNTPGEGKIPAGTGTSGEWKAAKVSILFEIPKFPIMSDSEMVAATTGTIRARAGLETVRIPEYMRHTLFEFSPATETLAARNQLWEYTSVVARAATASGNFPGDRTLRQPKGVLKATWFDVAEDFLMLGNLIPSNWYARLSTVNARPFPLWAYRDQNKADDGTFENYVRFRPGTLLLMPPKIVRHSMNHPAILKGEISEAFFPKTVTLESHMPYFDPPSRDTTTIDLSDERYGPGGAAYAATLVRGHALVPLPRPTPAGDIWFTAVNTPVRLPTDRAYAALQEPARRAAYLSENRPLTSDSQLLYPYSSFEALWLAAESLP